MIVFILAAKKHRENKQPHNIFLFYRRCAAQLFISLIIIQSDDYLLFRHSLFVIILLFLCKLVRLFMLSAGDKKATVVLYISEFFTDYKKQKRSFILSNVYSTLEKNNHQKRLDLKTVRSCFQQQAVIAQGAYFCNCQKKQTMRKGGKTMFIIEAIFSFLRDTLGVILAILLGTLCLSMVINLIVIVVKNTYSKFKKNY